MLVLRKENLNQKTKKRKKQRLITTCLMKTERLHTEYSQEHFAILYFQKKLTALFPKMLKMIYRRILN